MNLRQINMRKGAGSLVVVFLLFGLMVRSEVLKDTTLEDKVIHKVLHVREVREANRYIDSFTHHRRGVSIMVVSRPTAK
jgi:hypothetical protein